MVGHTGGNGTAGEWGHNPLPWMDEDELRYRQEVPCYCGKQGCIETFISGTGFATDYQRLSGKPLKGSEIISLVNAQDTLAEQALSRYELRLAKSLAHVVNILDPDVIVLGGGMSNVDRLYQNVPTLMKQFVLAASVKRLYARRCTVTPAACAARHGCGRTYKRLLCRGCNLLLHAALQATIEQQRGHRRKRQQRSRQRHVVVGKSQRQHHATAVRANRAAEIEGNLPASRAQ